MASSHGASDFGTQEAARENWYSDSSSKRPRSSEDNWHSSKRLGVSAQHAQVASASPNIGSDITAWQTTLQTLPVEFKNQPQPVHPLAQALANQPALRQVEWNPFSRGFVPRTPHDFASMMIFICGQVNPNPCRNCQLKNGPYAKCVVSPPDVLANSSMRHACCNCTYQNQYKKCTNDPVTEEELTRKLYAKRVASGGVPVPRKPKISSSVRKHKKQEVQQAIAKPSAQSISPDAFADKLRQARGWSPRSRKRMQAEVLQWQAAIATVEAEETEVEKIRNFSTPSSSSQPKRPLIQSSQLSLPRPAPVPVTTAPVSAHAAAVPVITPVTAPVARPLPSTPSMTPTFAPAPPPPPPSLRNSNMSNNDLPQRNNGLPQMNNGLPNMDMDMDQDNDEYSEVTDSPDEVEGDDGYEDEESWGGLGMGTQIKAPL